MLERKKIILGIFYVICYCIITALSSVLINYFERSINPILLTFFSFFLTTLLFNFINFKNSNKIKLMITQHFKLFILFNITSAIMWGAVFYGLKYLNPDIVIALYFGVMPIATALMTIRQPKNSRVRKAELFFSVILLLILVALSLDDLFTSKHKLFIFIGIDLAILGGVIAAITNILAHRFAKLNFSATQVLSQRFYLLVIFSGLGCLFLQRVNWVWSFNNFIDVILVTIMSVALPLFFLQKGLGKLDPVFVAFITPFIPVITFFLQLLEPHARFNLTDLILIFILSLTIFASIVTKSRLESPHKNPC